MVMVKEQIGCYHLKESPLLLECLLREHAREARGSLFLWGGAGQEKISCELARQIWARAKMWGAGQGKTVHKWEFHQAENYSNQFSNCISLTTLVSNMNITKYKVVVDCRYA